MSEHTKKLTIQRIEEDSLSPKLQLRENKRFVIMKKIAKHGNQAIIVIPRMLEEHLQPGTIVQLNIEVLSKVGEK